MNKNIAIFITIIFTVIMLFPAVCVSAKEAELNVSFTSAKNSITLEWEATGEKILQSTVYKYNSAKKKYTKLTSTSKKSYTEKKLDAGERVQYKITAKLRGGKTVSKIITANTLLEDIPMHDEDYQGSTKAFVYNRYDTNTNYLIYRNCSGEKVIYKSNKYFDYEISISEDGTTVYYAINDILYRYSYAEGKSKKTTTLPSDDETVRNSGHTVISSSNGEYCLVRSWKSFRGDTDCYKNYFTIWHDGKTVTSEYTSYYPISVKGISNDGRVFYIDDPEDKFELHLFSFDTGKDEVFAEIDLEGYPYRTDVFFDKNSYIIESLDLIYGKIGSAYQNAVSDLYRVIKYDGKSAIVTTDDDTVYRLNLENGDSLELVNGFSYFACTEDMDTAVLCDYQSKKLVRLSGWNEKENCYKNRQEISVPELTHCHTIGSYSPDLNIVCIKNESIEGSSLIAYFDSGIFQETKCSYYPIIDRFGNVLLRENGANWYLLKPDGSETYIFNDGNTYYNMCNKRIGGFVILGREEIVSEGDGWDYGYYVEYYIDENGKPVYLWDDREDFEITYARDPEEE